MLGSKEENGPPETDIAQLRLYILGRVLYTLLLGPADDCPDGK